MCLCGPGLCIPRSIDTDADLRPQHDVTQQSSIEEINGMLLSFSCWSCVLVGMPVDRGVVQRYDGSKWTTETYQMLDNWYGILRVSDVY